MNGLRRSSAGSSKTILTKNASSANNGRRRDTATSEGESTETTTDEDLTVEDNNDFDVDAENNVNNNNNNNTAIKEEREEKHEKPAAAAPRNRKRSLMISQTGGITEATMSFCIDIKKLRPELVSKIKAWIISFRHLDPRYKILKFFNQVASEGADNMMDEDSENDCEDSMFGGSVNRRESLFESNESTSESFTMMSRRSSSKRSHDAGGTGKGGCIDENRSHYGDDDNMSRSVSFDLSSFDNKFKDLFSKAFDATSILTVWRPCSNDAMRKMMEGTGVGKGLDIKGKSAKKGLLSAFVPFMQIHSNEDKSKISEIYEDAYMRVYFSSSEARQTVIDTIKPYASTTSSNNNNNADDDDDGNYKSYDIIRGDIEILDEYENKGWYGMEVSQRLFWVGCIKPQDITRNDDTVTGRPSLPGFQDANMKTLKVACTKHPSPMPVVVQYDKINAMKPQTLVMAYEENGTVTPVVSDFDGFLLGWRREALWFGCNLPREQEDLMMWCIDHIEDVLDGEDESKRNESWTVQWLDILKKEASNGFVPETPEYGFGDPKSYGIMERAANMLIDTGAVRHGAECFNYYFPQEMDDYFLLISDTLHPVPWKYVNATELQDILIRKIHEGFVFPLNPKWILCDPGWKRVYDELMKSDALYADMSKDVWFPPHVGIREKIEEICQRHPNGFFDGDGSVAESDLDGTIIANSGKARWESASLQLMEFEGKKGLLSNLRSKIKRRRARNRARKLTISSNSNDQVTGLQAMVVGLEADKARLKIERELLRKERDLLESERTKLNLMNSNQRKTIQELESAMTPDESEIAKRIIEREEELEKGTALLANLYYTNKNSRLLLKRGTRMNHQTGGQLPEPNEEDANEQYDMLQDAIKKKQSKWWKSLDRIFFFSTYIEPIPEGSEDMLSDD